MLNIGPNDLIFLLKDRQLKFARKIFEPEFCVRSAVSAILTVEVATTTHRSQLDKF